MPKPELFCLKEMLVSVCQMNIHLWDAPENAQTDSAGDARGAEKILKEYLPFPPPHVRVKEKERKEQPKPILCESVAEKDADSVKDSGFRRAWNYQKMISELTAENRFLLLGWFGSTVLAFALYPTG